MGRLRLLYRYRYSLYGFLVATVYCVLLLVLHSTFSKGTPGQLLRDFPAAAILVFLSLPVYPLVGYLLGAQKDRCKEAVRLSHDYQKKSESLQDLSERLTHSEEMIQLAGVVAGEMKHPLTSIVGYALTLREFWDKLDDDTRRTFLSYIKISSSKLEAMSNDLMRIMELSRGFPRPHTVSMDLKEIMDEVCGILEDIYTEKGLKTNLRFHEDIPLFQSDPAKFFDLLYNLLDICMRCSVDNGMISIWCSYKSPRLNLRLRCHRSIFTPLQIAGNRKCPPGQEETEMATLSMEYRLADAMLREMGGDVRLETLGESGFTFAIFLLADR
ncbi:MAG: hypothetical protein AB1384_11950 [Actinomycetota bacterium]